MGQFHSTPQRSAFKRTLERAGLGIHPKSDPIAESVYNFVALYIEREGYPPSVREIAAACYIGVSTVCRKLDQLQAAKRVSRTPFKERSLRLIGAESQD